METGPEFADWAAARQRRLVRAAYLMTGDLRRQDLVQEALVKVCQRWERLRGGNPEAYARTIVFRDHVSWWRRRKEYAVADVRDEQEVSGPDVEGASVVRDALLRLPQRQRAVLVLRYFDDLTEAQAAEVMGIRVGTVKSQTRRVARNLREHAPELGDLVGRETTHE